MSITFDKSIYSILLLYFEINILIKNFIYKNNFYVQIFYIPGFKIIYAINDDESRTHEYQ